MLVPLGALAAAPAWLVRSIRHPEYRAHVGERLGRLPRDLAARLDALPRRPVWVQAVSVGEVAVARTLMEAIDRSRDPGDGAVPFLLTSTTPAGRDAAAAVSARGMAGACHFPLDWAPLARRALDAVRPAAFVAVETEIWPRLMSLCARRGVPMVMVNGRISARSHARYLKVRGLLREPLAGIGVACMQTEEDAARLLSLGLPGDRVTVTGNMKFDAPVAAGGADDLRELYGLPRGGAVRVLVAGSTSPGEEEMVLDALAAIDRPEVMLVLAPRHRERFEEVARLLAARGVAFARSSLFPQTPRGEARVVLLDTLGELARVYDMADVAFVGGSLVPRGGQNLIEPAARGVPVLYGPHTTNFAAIARAVAESGAGFVVRDAADLARQARRLLADDTARAQAGRAGRALIEAHRGATERTIRHVARFLGC